MRRQPRSVFGFVANREPNQTKSSRLPMWLPLAAVGALVVLIFVVGAWMAALTPLVALLFWWPYANGKRPERCARYGDRIRQKSAVNK